MGSNKSVCSELFYSKPLQKKLTRKRLLGESGLKIPHSVKEEVGVSKWMEKILWTIETLLTDSFFPLSVYIPVRSDDNGLSSLLTLGHHTPQFPSGHRVNTRRRLVQEYDGRLSNERHRCAELALVTSAIRAAPAIRILFQTCSSN